MTRTNSPNKGSARRLTALALALLFLLQSAARAGSGCLSSVFTARCCCVESSVETPTDGQHACCAKKVTSREGPQHSPSAQEQGGCCCQLAPLPNAPSDSGTSWGADRKRHLLTIDALKLAQAPIEFAIQSQLESAISTHPRPGPPGSSRRVAATSTSTATRLAQRGVIGLLSDLGTFLE